MSILRSNTILLRHRGDTKCFIFLNCGITWYSPSTVPLLLYTIQVYNSLDISIIVGIATFHFMNRNGLLKIWGPQRGFFQIDKSSMDCRHVGSLMACLGSWGVSIDLDGHDQVSTGVRLCVDNRRIYLFAQQLENGNIGEILFQELWRHRNGWILSIWFLGRGHQWVLSYVNFRTICFSFNPNIWQ